MLGAAGAADATTMRDPLGRLHFSGKHAIRRLHAPLEPTAFLNQSLARQLVDAGQLVPFRLSSSDATLVESPRYDFVSLPTEWTDAQLRVAADLTLDLAEQALAAGYELKDASAWNVVFEGCAPRFCDHLSFELIAMRRWWAFGQFCRHFVFPLACSRWRGLPTRAVFRISRDGMTAAQARAVLGLRGRVSRLAPLLLKRAAQTDGPPLVQQASLASDGRPLHGSLIDYARRCLMTQSMPAKNRGVWTEYVNERPHYSEPAVQSKVNQVHAWLGHVMPHTLLDLGCNTGEFSHLALEFAQRVIAIDSDHDCVQRLFNSARGDTRLHPLVADLGDLDGGRGWAATEFPGLLERLAERVDTTLMLALIHHLHLSEGIPLPDIAALAARITSDVLIVELIEHDDSMVQHLAAQRQRDARGFTITNQIEAFNAHFQIERRVVLEGTSRELALMRRRT